jgi:excisionase family DNA binding protein
VTNSFNYLQLMTTTTEQQHDLLTVRELGEYLRVSTRTAYQLIYDGHVPHVRIGGSIRIPRVALVRVLAKSMGRSP